MKKYLLALILIDFCVLLAVAQQTGSFTMNVTFSQADYQFNRDLHYFVPDDYDESHAYPIVVGFRGGPHSSAAQFRDQLTFLSTTVGAIILCPENSHHFNNQEGLVKQLFLYSLDTTTSLYNIDLDKIYLTGLSYGGRHATIVAMDTDAGPIPAIRGFIPFAAGSNSHLQPNYDAVGEFAPACICIGLNDNANFLNVSRTLHMDILLNGGNAFLNEIPNVGHTVAFASYPDEMMECFNYIEAQYSGLFDHADFSQFGLTVTPNPVNDHLLLNGNVEKLNIQQLSVYSLYGQKLLSIANDFAFIDVSSLQNGTYVLVAEINNELYQSRFVVNK